MRRKKKWRKDIRAILRTIRTESGMEMVMMAILVAKQGETREERSKTTTRSAKTVASMVTK